MAVCIPKNVSEQLRTLVRKEGITIDKLMDMSPTESRAFFARADEGMAKELNALFLKAKSSTQKQAMRNWVWKTFHGGKPLYSELTLKQSQAMQNAGLRVRDLKAMTLEQRINKLAEFVDRDTAVSLNKRFETSRASGNLANWEERVIGTKEMLENKKLQGGFSKLEALDDMGFLTPKQTEKFMEDLVSFNLGVDVSVQEAATISRMTKKVSDLWEKASPDMTWNNAKNIEDFFVAKKELQNFVNKLSPEPINEVFTSLGARGAILFSLRSLTNSQMFQIIPGITTAIQKRIGSAALLPGDLNKMQKIAFAVSSSFRDSKWIWNQTRLGFRIYRKTGYDISRMQTLDDGFRFFGEKFTHAQGPTLKEAQGVKEKMGAVVRAHARLMEPGVKYAAGGTDAFYANLQRADTTAMLARTKAKMEATTGKLPKGVSEAERARQLMNEAYSFNPKSETAQYIREMGITDGHLANFTNNDGWGQFALRVRDAVKIGNFSIGKVIEPFLKIPANAMGKGFEASGPGLITNSQSFLKALKMSSGVEKNMAIAKSINGMITAAGVFGSAVFFSSLLNPDDFIGHYDWKKRSENKLTEAKNAGSSYMRIGNMWYSTRWLGPAAIPLNAIMYSRQARNEGKSALNGYLRGMLWGMAQFPLTLVEPVEKIKRFAEREEEDFLKAIGVNPNSMVKWLSVRAIPSFFTYDILALKNETKFDFQGRPVPKRGDSLQSAVAGFFIGSNIKMDTSNAITKEADFLSSKGFIPVLVDPSGKTVEKAMERLGEDAYLERLNKLKQDYAEALDRMIQASWYQRLSPENRKKEWDRLRQREILNRF